MRRSVQNKAIHTVAPCRLPFNSKGEIFHEAVTATSREFPILRGAATPFQLKRQTRQHYETAENNRF